MDEGWVIEHIQHELVTVLVVGLKDIARTGHTLIKGLPIVDRCLEIPHIASQVMR